MAEIEAAFENPEFELKEGGKGVFDVRVDDVLVYSKYETGRHANPGEVVAAIRAAHADPGS